MTENQTPNAGDYRRAAVLTLHHRRDNHSGVAAIMDETNDGNRGPQLLHAILNLHQTLIGLLRTVNGVTLLADWVHGMASLEPPDARAQDLVRAAQILDNHGRSNRQGIAEVMNAATSEGRATQTLGQLLGLYDVALPELSGRGGLDWLEAQIMGLAEAEHRPDNDAQGGGSAS